MSTPTEPLFLDDTYLLKASARVLEVGTDEKRGAYAVLDQTVFYPQGGGQPADAGTITVAGRAVPVSGVGRDESGVVIRHFGAFIESDVGQSAELDVDGAIRLRNARLHTAGHLLSHAVEALLPGGMAQKGYHFADGPYVEFQGIDVPPADLVERAMEVIARDIQANLPVTAKLTDFETLKAAARPLPPNLPTDKPLRAVQIGSYPPMPCGGTHVRSIAELGDLRIGAPKRKSGQLRIPYTLA